MQPRPRPPGRGAARGPAEQGIHGRLGAASTRAPAGSNVYSRASGGGAGGLETLSLPLRHLRPCSTGPSWRFQVHGKTEAERGQQRQEARLDGLHAPSRAWTWSLQPTPCLALRGTHGSNCEPGNQRGLRRGATGAQRRPSPSLEVREGFLEELTSLEERRGGESQSSEGNSLEGSYQESHSQGPAPAPRPPTRLCLSPSPGQPRRAPGLCWDQPLSIFAPFPRGKPQPQVPGWDIPSAEHEPSPAVAVTTQDFPSAT